MRTLSNELSFKTLAHDLRTPLTTLRFLTHGLSLNEGQESIIDQCLEALEQMAMRVGQFGQTVPSEKARPLKLIENLKPRLSELAFHHQVNLSWWIPRHRNGVKSPIDSLELERVIINLFNNALEASSAGDTIAISGKMSGRFLEVNISDTGKGIPAELLDKITEPELSFNKENGSGLGLYQAKTALEKCGGHLFISSELGAGTQVRAFLPIIDKGESIEASPRLVLCA